MASEASTTPTSEAVDGVGEGGDILGKLVADERDLVVVGQEQQEMRAGLDLLLPDEGIELELDFGVGDIYHRKLLAVIACGGVAYGVIDEVHVLGFDVFALISADAAAVE